MCFDSSIWARNFDSRDGLSLELLQMGAFPVFVVDGQPSPLKSQVRAARFFRGSGMDLAALPSTEAEASADAPVQPRNAKFTRYVEDCVVSVRAMAVLVILPCQFRMCNLVVQDSSKYDVINCRLNTVGMIQHGVYKPLK